MEYDVQTYANMLIDQLIRIKDRHRSELSLAEVEVINDSCNLISHNLQKLEVC